MLQTSITINELIQKPEGKTLEFDSLPCFKATIKDLDMRFGLKKPSYSEFARRAIFTLFVDVTEDRDEKILVY